MASSFFRRLVEKFGDADLTGSRYQSLISKILAHNNEKIGRAIGRLSKKNYKKSVQKLSKEKAKTVKLPDVSDVLPKRSVFIIKGAEQGQIISNTLRDRLQRDLRNTLKDFEATGQGKMEIQRGKATGKINPKLIDMFQNKIQDVFTGYTKKDPRTGIPRQVKNIAVTETRSTINTIKKEYNQELLKRNPDMVMTKTWLHNRRLSKKPRQEHIDMNGITVNFNDKFKVASATGGFDLMDRPHDPDAPAEQVIGCNCDYVVKAQLPK